jgi:hypothetical protein
LHATIGWIGPKEHSGVPDSLLPNEVRCARWAADYNQGVCVRSNFRRPFRLPGDTSFAAIHAGCWCTERAALERRVFVDQTMTESGFSQLCETERDFRYLFRRWKLSVLTREQAVLELSVHKRRRYLDALKSLNTYPICDKDAQVRCFVKADKLDSIEESERKPRAIQGRSPRFNLEIARYLKPIEHKLMGWKGPRRGVVRSRVFAKGLNSRQRASLIVQKCSSFRKPVVFCVDASAFDASVTKGHLTLCHSLYMSMIGDSLFRSLLSKQLVNVGSTINGHKYIIRGNRMSGDVDTGIGNSLLNILVFTSAMRVLGVRKWDFLCDGDDALVFVEEGDLVSDDLSRVCKDLGFILYGEPVTITNGDYWQIEFCRSHPIWTREGWVMCRNMQRAVDTFGLTHRYADVPLGAYRSYLAGCGICEMSASRDLPMIGELSYYASMLSGKKIYGQEEQYRGGILLSAGKLKKLVSENRRPDVHPTTREQVALAFNISVEAQIDYENSVPLRMLNLNCEVVTLDAVTGNGEYLMLRE